MKEFRFHWWQSGAEPTPVPSITFEVESALEGAALALRHFSRLGCDISAPLAHIDLTDADGVNHTLLVEEVLAWLSDPTQADLVQREGLAALLH